MVLTLAALSLAALLPNGTYTYDLRVGGQVIGTSAILIRRSGDTLDVQEHASMAGRTLTSDRTIGIADFATRSYTVDAGGKHLVLTIAGNDATLASGGKTQKITAAAGAPFVVNDNMAAGFALMPAALAVTGAKRLTLACLCGGFVAVPVSLNASATGSATITLAGQTATLRFDPQTLVLDELDLPAQSFSLVRRSYSPSLSVPTAPVAPTPVPLAPAQYASRDVTIVARDGVRLRGTLTLPHAAGSALPGFVLVHGSGCNDRDETIGPNKIFAQLANRLSNDGYAVLRYDKRSCGQSGGTFPLRDRLIADALDVIRFLRAQPGIDPKRIYVLGHSEGGELAPSIAIADKRLRGIVLMAPPALPLEKILMQQALHFATPANRAEVAAKEQAQLDAIAAGKKQGAEARWLRSSFGIDPAVLIARVPCPILILQGTKDFQVLPADTPRLVGAARAAHRNVTVAMLPGDNHLFIKLQPSQSSTLAEYFVPSYLDPALFDAIEAWLAQN